MSHHKIDVTNNSASDASVIYEWTHKLVVWTVENYTRGTAMRTDTLYKDDGKAYKKNHPRESNRFVKSGWMGIDSFTGVPAGTYKLYAYTLLRVLHPKGTVVDHTSDEWKDEFKIGL